MKELLNKAGGLLSKETPIFSLIILVIIAEAYLVYYPPEIVECASMMMAQILIAVVGVLGCLLKLIQILKGGK